MEPLQARGAGDDETAKDVTHDGQQIVFSPHTVEVFNHPKGYREFRALPATWHYPEMRPFHALLTEYSSARKGADPHGVGEHSEFWSGSDAALRLRMLPADDLAVRELTALASRRSIGFNAPRPWVAEREAAEMVNVWKPEVTDIHFSQHPFEKEAAPIWTHYGMKESYTDPVILSYGTRTSLRSPLGRAACAWAGGPGTWYAWSTLVGWERWPRRQEGQPLATAAHTGQLLLFISHRWESLEHPDPTGAQLLCLKVGLTLALAAAVLQLGSRQKNMKSVSGLPETIAEFLEPVLGSEELIALQQWAEQIKAAAECIKEEQSFWAESRRLEMPNIRLLLGRIRSLILVWYDYASMWQAPRSQHEEVQFRREILELNRIQAHATTVVIAGDERYLSRAWCFLELCGGMRQRIVELTPSWGIAVGVGDSVTKWASRSDQLIGALNVLGSEAIGRCGLEATKPEDLADIAKLLGELPLTAVIESDDSDLVGGVLPIPFQSGEWILPVGPRGLPATREYDFPPMADFGRLPGNETLRRVAEQHAGADALGSTVGMWIYSTQRALTLAWAARAHEFWQTICPKLLFIDEYFKLQIPNPFAHEPSVACMWADSRSLADDGLGWTRAIPSTVQLLVIITQVDMPQLCRVYEWVVRAHVAHNVSVVTYAPETGRMLLYLPGYLNGFLGTVNRNYDVLAVPRIRRPDACANRMFIKAGTSCKDIEILAALRLDPAQGLVPPRQVCYEAAAEGLGCVGEEITALQLLGHSESRVRTEGLARSTAGAWDEFSPLNWLGWHIGTAPLQIRIIDQLVRKVLGVSQNPFLRRKHLRILLKDSEGFLLSSDTVQEAEEFIEWFLRNKGVSPD